MTWQLAWLAVPASVHDPPPEKVPAPSVVKSTLSVGVVGLAVVSVTVAVQVVPGPSVTDVGTQATEVVVGCRSSKAPMSQTTRRAPRWSSAGHAGKTPPGVVGL